MGAGSVASRSAACAPGSSASGSPTAAASASAAASTAAPTASVRGAVASSLPSCVVVPELTEGPYYVNENLDRSDIRIDTADGSVSEGAVLTLDWVVSQVDGSACIPLEGVLVDVWHCDALGNYSDVGEEQGHDFLRGYQRTDASGKARIVTVYPGWYQGRAVHIHFKIRTDADAASGLEFTSQLFFDDAFSAQVFASGVYAAKGDARPAQRLRRHLPAEPGDDAARRRARTATATRPPSRSRSRRPERLVPVPRGERRRSMPT